MDPISAMRLFGAGGGLPTNPTEMAPSKLTGALPQGLSGIDPESLKGIATQAQASKVPTLELPGLGNVGPAAPLHIESVPGARSFSDYLGQMVRDVNAKQAAASETVNGVLSGENVPLHKAMLSVEEASVSFQLMVEVRNKLLESYQELMRMQI